MTKKLRQEKVWVYISSTTEESQETEDHNNDRTYITDNGLLLKEKEMYTFTRTELTNFVNNILDLAKSESKIELESVLRKVLE